ncbi:mediator of RNA polymerase II transcription subunit 1-domain-containing protein [Plectosphaerella plurivora]|uniref:Mediator of RNA polymerase II transcription subunit 1 n=1 Tax=Plectosphaerella plurivora TaxID=936078 RepID=A0A9P8VL60_9PEZI|nr:mediator of RNA polymerase II transcription subunit 1-domain-containing protein [Plectosphaerella plurivora]
METPTNPAKLPPGYSQPGQSQGRTPSGIPGATPPVSTPFSVSQAHAAFSPHGPKSSPQQFKKSPANSATLMGHHGNPPLNFDSPSAAAAMGALGMSAGLDLGLDGVGVGSMGGLSLSTGEDDRIKRLDAIVNILGNAKGLVSAAGLERLSLRTGLNKMWEEIRTPDGRTTQTLVMAGHGLQLDINLDNNIVQSVTVAFPESEGAPSVAKHADKAGQILLRDLELLPNQSPLTKTLDKFAINLERLATLDKLSVFPGLDCQEAIIGIYDSLEKLYQWELTKARADEVMAGKPEGLVEATVMCARSGRPGMHVRDQVGLSIDYWTDRRLVFHRAALSKDEEGPDVWAISVGCRPLDGDLYHAVRVSDAWLSSDVEKTKPTPEDLLTVADGPIIDWLEPDATTVPQTTDDKPGDLNLVQPDGKKLPNAKFVATFNPPLIVPQSVANNLYHLVGTQPPAMLTGNTFDGLFFPIREGTNHDASEPRMISCKRDVLAKTTEGNMAPVTHENMLFVYKPVYGQTIAELPFSHPRQLVAMLPTLRQYALISTLLSRSFTSESVDRRPNAPGQVGAMPRSRTLSEGFDEFVDAGEAMTKPQAGATTRWEGPLGLDVLLSVHPTAGLSVVFPFRDATANVELQIQQNGGIHVVSQNILPTGEEAEGDAAMPHVTEIGKKMRPQDLGRVLSQLEDLCSWAEWIRLNLS